MSNATITRTPAPEFLNSRLVNFTVEMCREQSEAGVSFSKLPALSGLILALPDLFTEIPDPENGQNPWVSIMLESGSAGYVRKKTLARWFQKREDGQEWPEILSGFKGRGKSVKEVKVNIAGV